MLYLFKVTLSGKKDSEKHRRRRKEKNELCSDAENDDCDNALNEMKISGSQEDVHDSEIGKVGCDFPVPYMNISVTISTSSDRIYYVLFALIIHQLIYINYVTFH